MREADDMMNAANLKELTMKITRILLLATVLSTVVLLGEDVEDEVLQAERNWAASVVAGDFDRVEALLDDTLIYAHSTGIIESKDQYLGKLRSGAQHYDSIEHEKTTVRVHGDAAVVHSIGVMTGKNANGPFHDRLMIMHFWVNTDGKWLLGAHQTTRLVE